MHLTLYHDAVIPPPKYGGTERIIHWLVRGLIELGHPVTLIAAPGSAVPGAELILLTEQSRAKWQELVPKTSDLIHLWGTPQTKPDRPYLVTIQGNGRPGERFDPNTVFISASHAANHGGTQFVYNGIDPGEYPCDEVREDFVVFLAKAAWKVKNLAGAIEIARAARTELVVMGSRDWPLGLQRRLPAFRGVRYLGMVGDVEKREFLRKARALLFPVRWPEPFGIAITEALASGCAVLGTPYGSLPEIVTNEVGALSADAEVLLRALQERRHSPGQSRARVLEGGFTHLAMAKRYAELYSLILNHGSLHPVGHEGSPAPRALFEHPAETLLPWKSLKERRHRPDSGHS